MSYVNLTRRIGNAVRVLLARHRMPAPFPIPFQPPVWHNGGWLLECLSLRLAPLDW